MAHPKNEGPDPIKVGTTGHRVLPFDLALIVKVDKAIDELMSRYTEVEVLSPLAEGADRLLSKQFLEHEGLVKLTAMIPMDSAEYMKDFESEGSRLEFRSLAQKASIIYISYSGEINDDVKSPEEVRKNAYEACGRQMVEKCDLLVAIWDGDVARGRGGTGDVVDLARKSGKPVLWIESIPPYRVHLEEMLNGSVGSG